MESISINIVMNMQVDSYCQLKQRQQFIQELLSNKTSDLSLLSQYTAILDQKIILEQQLLKQEQPAKSEGRGGNNIAENLKKSNVAVLRKELPKEEFQALKLECIQRHKLKSQKENTIIFFLYLYKLEAEGRINLADIERIRLTLQRKIDRYISNSMEKMALQGRKNFHQKNIQEFRRFQQLDVNFSQKRSFTEISQQLRPFYLRKQVEYTNAVKRLAKFVGSHPVFQSFFTDIGPTPVKEEETAESSTPSASNPPQPSQ